MKLEGEVVVTGGCGAIGSNLVRRVLREPAVTRVLVIDDLSAGFEWLLLPLRDKRLELCRRSILGDDLLCGFEEPREPIVLHLAAHFANALSLEEPVVDTLVNIVGTVEMLEWAKHWKARHFVFASAGCAAGHEDTPYQVSKAAGEAYCRLYFPEVPTAVARFHNSYGPGEVPGQWRNVIPNFIHAALKGNPLVVHGDGTQRRDFVYVEDLVEDLVSLEPSRKAVEVGTGVATQIGALARAIVAATGSASVIRYGADRPAWHHTGRAAETDFRPRVGLEEGLRRTVAWFQDNDLLIDAAVEAGR